MRISDWSSDVCSSDLPADHSPGEPGDDHDGEHCDEGQEHAVHVRPVGTASGVHDVAPRGLCEVEPDQRDDRTHHHGRHRSEEHTSELQSLMRISYAVFCLKKKKNIIKETN